MGKICPSVRDARGQELPVHSLDETKRPRAGATCERSPTCLSQSRELDMTETGSMVWTDVGPGLARLDVSHATGLQRTHQPHSWSLCLDGVERATLLNCCPCCAWEVDVQPDAPVAARAIPSSVAAAYRSLAAGSKAPITPMIGRIYVACSKPLGQLEPGEVRLLLGQCDGLPWIIPLALRFLEQDPLVCGTFYVGDLLEQVLGNEKIWQANPEVIPAIRAAIEQIEEAATVWCPNEDEYPERTWEALRLLEHLEQRGLWPWNPDLAERAPGTRAS